MRYDIPLFTKLERDFMKKLSRKNKEEFEALYKQFYDLPEDEHTPLKDPLEE